MTESKSRNRLVVPRNAINTKMVYSFYALKELSKGNVIFGNIILDKFKNEFATTSLPFPVSSSTVYEALYALEKYGYVTSVWSGDEFLNKRTKKVYKITDAGVEYYKTHVVDYIDNLNKTKSTLDKMINLLK